MRVGHGAKGTVRPVGWRRDVAVGVVAFVAMEPVAYAGHRWGMHGPGWAAHESHHRSRAGVVEANDLYPLGFAAATIVAMTRERKAARSCSGIAMPATRTTARASTSRLPSGNALPFAPPPEAILRSSAEEEVCSHPAPAIQVTPAGPFMAPAGCFVRGILLRV